MKPKSVAMDVDGNDPGDRGVIIVRRVEGRVALAVAIEGNGDAEVLLRPEQCERLIGLIREALKPGA